MAIAESEIRWCVMNGRLLGRFPGVVEHAVSPEAYQTRGAALCGRQPINQDVWQLSHGVSRCSACEALASGPVAVGPVESVAGPSEWMCACGWNGLVAQLVTNAYGGKSCPACGGSGGLILRQSWSGW